MNKFFYLLILIAVCVACDDTDNVPAPTSTKPDSFWEYPHSAFMGLEGAVSHVTDRFYLPDENSESEKMMEARFDTSGRLTYYNPTGIEPEISARWIGVASAYYQYQYNATGQLTSATVNEVGLAPCTYTLTYADHDCYVPLIFPMGPMGFFMVKGVTSIESNDKTIKYHFENNKATYSRSSWSLVTETTYEYATGSHYPARCVITKSRNNEVMEKEIVEYAFDAYGNLLSTDKKMIMIEENDQNNVYEHTILHYIKDELLLIESKSTVSGDDKYEWEYTYLANKLLAGILCKHNGEYMPDEESYSFSDLDEMTNWTHSIQKTSSSIDWNHQDITLDIQRQISYWQ